ncbi:unnamed protein product [Rotaria sp. Silwood2]|nr:unnamed protein product [Rotaria sp. Silwood2]CAF3113906.1 unnamed protein product [Rotaria sp. Silwood2]CAF3277483.1 unnamed protein product [Rotaria sp. Silwood2]CAF3435870.1 unnamed protein product [Rotaria sp. Silwood2]CAF4132704.1 unnamed protein product [Rotaria sp. Silwood2]
MSRCELERLEKSINQLISINSFFSTTMNKNVALEFAKNNSNVPSTQLIPVLFNIHADTQVGLTKPFADITKLSAHKLESEVLFMLGSVFRLDNIQHVQDGDDQMTIIEMSLCGDKHGLKKLYKHMRKHNGTGDTNLFSFANVLRLMGKYDDAEKYYRRCLHEMSSTNPLLGDLYYNLGLVLKYRCDYDTSFELHEKALKILMQRLPSDSLIIGNIHNSIGEIHWAKHDHERALQAFNQAVQLFQQANLNDHSDMALFLDNIGLVYQQQKHYPEALIYCSKSLSIRQQRLPSNHPDLAMSYNKVGMIRWNLDQSDLAIELLQEALNIRKKALPTHHPDIALSYRDLGVVYESTGQYKLALKSFRQASEIYSNVWKDDHPKIVEIHTYIESVSQKCPN